MLDKNEVREQLSKIEMFGELLEVSIEEKEFTEFEKQAELEERQLEANLPPPPKTPAK